MFEHTRLEEIFKGTLADTVPPAELIKMLRLHVMKTEEIDSALEAGQSHPNYFIAEALTKSEIISYALNGETKTSIRLFKRFTDPSSCLRVGVELLDIATSKNDLSFIQNITDCVSSVVSKTPLLICETNDDSLNTTAFNVEFDEQNLTVTLSLDPRLLHSFYEKAGKAGADLSRIDSWIFDHTPEILQEYTAALDYLDELKVADEIDAAVAMLLDTQESRAWPDDIEETPEDLAEIEALEQKENEDYEQQERCTLAVDAVTEYLHFCCTALQVKAVQQSYLETIQRLVNKTTALLDEDTIFVDSTPTIIIPALVSTLRAIVPHLEKGETATYHALGTINPAIEVLLRDESTRADGFELAGTFIALLLRSDGIGALTNEIVREELEDMKAAYLNSLRRAKRGEISGRPLREYSFKSLLQSAISAAIPDSELPELHSIIEKMLGIDDKFDNKIATFRPVQPSEYSDAIRSSAHRVCTLIRAGKSEKISTPLGYLAQSVMKSYEDPLFAIEQDALGYGGVTHLLMVAQTLAKHGHSDRAKKVLAITSGLVRPELAHIKEMTEFAIENQESSRKDFIECAARCGCVSLALDTVRESIEEERTAGLVGAEKSTAELARRLIQGLAYAPIAE